MSVVRRRITLTFQIGKGSFGASGFDTITVEGLRTAATITKAGGVSMSMLQLRVQGLSLSLMNQLSTLGKPLVDGRNNKVTVSAGDDESGVAVAFIGTISEAWVDMSAAPDGVFVVAAHSGLLDALKPVPPISFQGQADAAVIMAGLAQQMELAFENSGVSVQLANPYFPGTAREQALACATAANINWVIDDSTLAIWPKGGSRGGQVPVLSKDTGMVGYPTHTQNGIVVVTLYNPSITFGGQVEVHSSLTPAAGTWTVFSVAHDLEAETPGGKWFTRLECSVLGYAPLAR